MGLVRKYQGLGMLKVNATGMLKVNATGVATIEHAGPVSVLVPMHPECAQLWVRAATAEEGFVDPGAYVVSSCTSLRVCRCVMRSRGVNTL